jgi:hypothetical protein
MLPEIEKSIIDLCQVFSKEVGLEFTVFTGSEDGSTMSLVKQIQLFDSARVVIGPHGGGLANLMYMNSVKPSFVCEFTSGTAVNIHGGRPFLKNFNQLLGCVPELHSEYYLIPFSAGSTLDFATIDLLNLKKFLLVASQKLACKYTKEA